jgi:pimeloyl-ACP methyl ester carboxylesterase
VDPRVDDVTELADGRRLGHAEWGPVDGFPILQFHGSPAGRLHRWGDAAALDRLGIRLITPDRPGVGRSDAKRGRVVADWPADVRELSDHLGLSRFGVIGFSMGGAYAAACAASLPDRVSGVALVSAIGRVDERGVDSMGVAPYLKLARRAPWAMRAIYTTLAAMARRNPDRAHEQFWRKSSRVDREIVDRPEVRERYWPAMIDALAGRGRGAVEDMRTIQRPWGFDPSDIRAPVHLFHGRKDRVVPAAEVGYWIDTLPDCEVHWYDDAGHFLIEDRFEEIVQALTSAAPAPEPSGSGRDAAP